MLSQAMQRALFGIPTARISPTVRVFGRPAQTQARAVAETTTPRPATATAACRMACPRAAWFCAILEKHYREIRPDDYARYEAEWVRSPVAQESALPSPGPAAADSSSGETAH